jgi:hypothetical protein
MDRVCKGATTYVRGLRALALDDCRLQAAASLGLLQIALDGRRSPAVPAAAAAATVLYFVQSVLLLHEGSARTALDLSESQVLASPVPPTPRNQQVLLIGPPANLMQPLDLVGRERSALVRSTKYFVLYSVPKRARETASKGTRALNRALRPSGLEHHPHAN